MAEYAGYSGYDAESVKRKRAYAEALQQRMLAGQGQPIQSWTQGAAKLANAWFAREAMQQADEAEQGLTTGRKAIADKMLASAFPGAAPPTEEGPAFDLTPAAMEKRQAENDLGDQVRNVADLTGDPLAAMQYGQGQQDRARQLATDALTRQALQQKLKTGNYIEVNKGATLYDMNSGESVFTAPGDPADPPPGSLVHSVVIGADGKPHAIMRDASDKPLDFTVQDNFGTVDIGGVPATYSRRTGATQEITTPEAAAQRAGTIEAGKAMGKTQAEAMAKMPEAIANADRAIASIDELLKSPGFNEIYGIANFNPLNYAPGSPARNADAIRKKLDGQFFISAITSMQESLAPVSDADALRLVSSISQLSNPDISPDEARRVATELKDYFTKAKERARAATTRGPVTPQAAVKIASGAAGAEEYAKLPKGAFYINPDTGKVQQKQ